MPDIEDRELLRTPEPSPEPSRRGGVMWTIAALAVVAIGAVIYYLYGRGTEPETAAVAPVPEVAERAEPSQPLGAEPEAVDLPPLGESDALVRSLVGALSSHPGIAAWLTTDDLIRNFTVVVSNVAERKEPTRHLRALQPSAPFATTGQGREIVLDARSYARYNGVADAVASLDPAGCARLYATLKPRIEEAYRELGFPDTPFDQTLERAIVQLLDTPVVDGPVRLEPEGATQYRFADPRLEALTPAQKHLLRTGPRNVRRIQSALRAIALALGIPASRLPAPPA